MKVKQIAKFLAILIVTPFLLAQSGCATTSGKVVKDNMIMEIKGKIKALGGTPLTEAEVKYQGKLNKDKYIVALRSQLAEEEKKKAEKEKKAEADKKAEEEKKKAAESKKKKEQDRAKVIQQIKKEIYFLGGTPILEFELGSEDKYIAALKKQIDELKAEKEAEEKKIQQAIPEWFVKVPQGSDALMYIRGTAVSDNLQLSIDTATNAALRELGKKLETRLNSKSKETVKQAGMGENMTSKTEFNRISSVVVKEVTVSGYEVHESKMVPLDNGNYRTFVMLKYPVTLAYKAYLDKIKTNNLLKGSLAKIKNTDAFKELEKAVNEFAGS
jgi:hypothetical protein